MKKYDINIMYGEDSLEELITESIVKELSDIIIKDKSNNYYGEVKYECSE